MALSPGYLMSDDAPTPDEYRRLRLDSGLSPKDERQAAGALSGSWAFRHVRLDGEAVGMGRVVGDGGWCFLIADMAVLPAHQGRGIGAAILDALLAEIQGRAPGAFVTLIADPPGRQLYASRGFHDVAPGQSGMSLWLGARE